MLSREARKEARKRGSAKRKIDLDGLVLRPKAVPSQPRASPKSPRVTRSPVANRTPRTPKVAKSPKADFSPETPEISSFMSPERPTPQQTPRTPKRTPLRTPRQTATATPKSVRRSTKPATPKVPAKRTPKQTPHSATGDMRSAPVYTPKRGPGRPKRAPEPQTPVIPNSPEFSDESRDSSSDTDSSAAPGTPPAPAYYDYVDQEVVAATRKRVTQQHREKVMERRSQTIDSQRSVQDKRRRSAGYLEIKYGRVPHNKTKLITLDVIKQALVDRLENSDIPEEAVGVQRKKTAQFLRNYKDLIDRHFSRLIDTYLTNNLILTELSELNKLKNEKRSRIYEIRQQRREISMELNSLRQKYLQKSENHRNKMRVYKQLRSVKTNEGKRPPAISRLLRLRRVIDPHFGVVDKLQVLNELLREV
ncbi:hypothetical protein KL949_001090 [Ogataea haglerorum]|uniref:Inner kinetochore subunit AME1 domain-containing protein n=1 Tax=Ogataea haglerorum TaxID=1937702 RepID=A0ABQ7RKH1_9ASCO|nr:uncharacterized protein KL911_001616 [Ogataea haglerorum]KAG7699694.1 hypothetical protein KL951_001411 [Ogataea haglerorum]KAG7721358.1 hypothetical protein KL913_001094 [Ogataea haglerorum]KAG7722112.1 hypothetical protein KL949_001090 [Ogataea haglerorum]KAG7732695.1 hypothetical protein KL948_002125 [Ogataea haglerorum]KAG7755559.1 hypothetical protein KL911_001616 [Ogataea haglerorum]